MTDDNIQHRHFKIYKPWGMLSQFVYPQGNRKKRLLGELHNFPDGTMAIGRLDADSEGLLFLTTNGKLSRLVTGRKIEKEYLVQVDGLATEYELAKLQSGVEITVKKEPYITLPAKVSILESTPDLPARIKKVRDERHGPTSWLSICISEGKYRQVRKMTAAVGLPTLRLVRYRIGNETIADFDNGTVQELKELDL